MSFQLTKRVIKLLCGPFSYERGEIDYRAGKVTITDFDSDRSSYRATVRGNNDYGIKIFIDDNGDVDAQCNCPVFDISPKYCKHIAAALLNIHDIQNAGKSPDRSYSSRLQSDGSNADASRTGFLTPRFATSKAQSVIGLTGEKIELAKGMLGLFGNRPARSNRVKHLYDAREMLDVEFTISSFPYGYRKYMFGIELKVGPKRLYVVKKLREWLDRIDRRERYEFSKHFAYEPTLHSFSAENDAIIGQLIEIYRSEKMYRETSSIYSAHANHLSGDRMLLIPPASWNALVPRLAQAPIVKLEQDNVTYEGVRLSDEPVPLQFDFNRDQTDNETSAYRLEVIGMDRITVMDAYGLVLSEGKLIKLKDEQCARLSELKQMLESSHQSHVPIMPEQMEPFMEQVIPGLMKLGNVRISQDVSERLLRTPLKAKLYLDRVRDRLLAGLEFHYGDIVINPLEGNAHTRGTDRILMREGEQEGQILDLMEQSPIFENRERISHGRRGR